MKNFWFLKLVVKLSGLYRPITLSSFLSVLSLTVGVSTLLVSMALVDSYERSFKDSLQSVFSHVVLYPTSKDNLSVDSVKKDISSAYKDDFEISESHKKEGLMAHMGKVTGVILEGVSIDSVSKVIDLKSKVIFGDFKVDGSEVSKSPRVLIGKGLFDKFALNLGDVFSVVIPQSGYGSDAGFSRKVFTYTVSGVVDLGKHSYNKRFIIMDKFHVNQASIRDPDHFSEVRVKLLDDDSAKTFKDQMIDTHPDKYWVQTWEDKSGGMLEAIYIERFVIFFLVLILVVVAAFNVSTNLYLNLAKRLKEFSVLQTIGMSKKQISKFMVLNALILASVGLVCGLFISLFIMSTFNKLLQNGLIVPPDVYKLTSISIHLSVSKFMVVAFATYLLCFMASIAPALSVSKLSVVRGLRYE